MQISQSANGRKKSKANQTAYQRKADPKRSRAICPSLFIAANNRVEPNQ